MNPALIPCILDSFGDGPWHYAEPFFPVVPDPPANRSQVGGDLSLIQSGPCKLSLNGLTVGHTMEGIKFSDQPDLRVRQVDEYGTLKTDMICQGENIDITTTLAQKTAVVLSLVYQWGGAVNASTYGIGKLPATVRGQILAQQLVIHPLSAGGSSASDATFFKALVSQPGEVNFGTATADRVFPVTFTCLVDESQPDGQLLGTIGVP